MISFFITFKLFIIFFRDPSRLTVFENHRKSLIQHCEWSELRLHFEWTKVNQKCLKWFILANFWKPKACGQTVLLPDRSVLIGQKLMENAKIQKFKCDILSNFQTMWDRLELVRPIKSFNTLGKLLTMTKTGKKSISRFFFQKADFFYQFWNNELSKKSWKSLFYFISMRIHRSDQM